MSEQEKDRLQQLIANGKADEALEIILAKPDLDNGLRRDYLLQTSRLNELEERERKRTISEENAALERNQINESLFNLLDGLPINETDPPSTPNPNRNRLKTISIVVGIIAAIAGIVATVITISKDVYNPTTEFVVVVREVVENNEKRIPLKQSGRVVVDFDNFDPLEFGIQNGAANCRVDKKLCESLFTLDLNTHQNYVPTKPDFNYSLLDKNNNKKDTIEFLIEEYIDYIVEVPSPSYAKLDTRPSTNSYIENNGSKFTPERIEGNKLIFKLPKSFDKTEKKLNLEMGDTTMDTSLKINKGLHSIDQSTIDIFFNINSIKDRFLPDSKLSTEVNDRVNPQITSSSKTTFEWEIEVGKEYKGEKIKLIYDNKGIGDQVGVVNEAGNVIVQLPEGTKELKLDATTIRPGLRPNVEVNKNDSYRLPKL